jgi:hypothetical protein
MNTFQIVALIGLSLLILATLTASVRGWATRREALTWSLLFLAMAIGIAWPDVTVRVADAVGIGRGADLVFYCGVIVMIVGFWMVYIRLRLLRRQLTLLVRKLAIIEGQREYPSE